VHNKEIGFVLKRFLPNKNKISVLSQKFGKIEIVTNPKEKIYSLWPGMLISFMLERQSNKIFFVQNLEIIMNPNYDHILDMSWVHKQLEIIYYFSAPQDPADQLFRYLFNSFNIHFFKKDFKDECLKIKTIYLVKLLELLGFYPKKDLIIYLSLYIDLTSMYIDFIDNDNVKLLKNNLQNIDLNNLKYINFWINSSLATHPNFKFFKTINMKEKF
jgi:hypothetical protein